MRLKSVTLNNFRCFESLKLDLHPRLTVIVGDNGAGKTALLDGVATALTPVLSHLSSANQRLGGRGIKDADFRIESSKGRGQKVNWAKADYAQVMVETYQDLRWDYWKPSGNVKGVEPPEKWGETLLKEHLAGIYGSYKTEQPRLTPVFSYYGASRGSIKVPERLREAKLNYDHPTAALYDCLDPTSDFREMLEWFDLEESSELRENKGVVNDDFEPFETLEAVRAAVVELLGDYSNPHFNNKHKFMLTRKADQAPLLVEQLSQGYQSMLALAMDFARRLAIANPHLKYSGDPYAIKQILDSTEQLSDWLAQAIDPTTVTALNMSAPAIMLVDEIDLHLHPSWQQRVLQDLMRTFPLTQFIVSTHSPQVLTTVPSECIRILRGGEIYEAPAGTEGAEPGRLLTTALGLQSVRPPENPATQELITYLALVDQNKWNSPVALALRKKLDDRYQGNEPALLEADLIIENRKWEQGE